MLNTLRLSSLLLTSALGLSGCFAMREARIESDYSYSGDFRRYRTYDFVSGEGLIADSSRLGQALRDAINARLRQQGYKPATKRPDLLVNFKLFEGSTKFRGYNQEELESWVKHAPKEDERTPEDMRQGYDPVRMLLTDGTLLVTLVDAHNQRAVWNGYASGVELPTGPTGEIVLRRSVRSIFDHYRVFTEGYLDSPAMPTSGN
jgi:hypothetical protein